jgi:hypothetical protein
MHPPEKLSFDTLEKEVPPECVKEPSRAETRLPFRSRRAEIDRSTGEARWKLK